MAQACWPTHRRRRVAIGGYSATASLSGLIGVSNAVWQVAILRAGAWTARGLRVPARNALLADIPGLMAALAIVYAIRCTPRPEPRPHQPIRLNVRAVLQGSLRPLMLGIGAFEMGNLAATLLILRATELLTPGHGATSAVQMALALYTAYNLAATVISTPAGALGDRLGNHRVLSAGAAAFLTSYVLLAVAGPHLAALAPAFLLAGIGIGCAETAEHAAVATQAPADLRGSAFGLLATLQSLGNFAASATAGILWTAVSPAAAFLFAAAAMLIALITLRRVGPTS